MPRLASIAAAAVCLSSGLAAAQTCPTPMGWRAPMTVMCPDEPALAGTVNANFLQVVTWLEAKVGQVGQPVALDAGVVTTTAIANGAVTNPKLATNAVNTTNIVDGAVTRAKLAPGPVVYEVDSRCPESGRLTRSSTCFFVTPTCGTNCNGIAVPRYENCQGVCLANPNSLCTAQACTVNNPVAGYLVAP